MSGKENAPKKGFARLWRLASPKKGMALCSCALGVLGAAAFFVPFLAAYRIIEEAALCYADPSLLDAPYLARLGLIAFGGSMAAVLLRFFSLLVARFAACGAADAMRLEFFRRLASLPLGFCIENPPSRLRKSLDANAERLGLFVSRDLPDLAWAVSLPLFALTVLFAFDWKLGLGSLAPAAAGFGILALVLGGKEAKALSKMRQDALEDSFGAAHEYFKGIFAIRAFGQTVYSIRRLSECSEAYAGRSKILSAFAEMPSRLYSVLTGQAYIVILPVAILVSGWVEDYASFAVSAVFYLLFSAALPEAFQKLLWALRLKVRLSEEDAPEGEDGLDAVFAASPLPRPEKPAVPEGYEISFENVSLSLQGPRRPLEGKPASFAAKEGEVTAITGRAGSGKSELARLLARFRDLRSGCIKIGGARISDIEEGRLMAMAGFVGRSPFLFSKSVRENIRDGDRSASDAETEKAAGLAGCSELISRLPQGYETVVGPKGFPLSEGDCQKIAIAREILKNAPILVLDEAACFFDPESERSLQKAFEELAKDKTAIFISRRPGSAKEADRIVVLEKGALAEEGTYSELMEKNGLYRRMLESQEKAKGFSLRSEEAKHA